MSMGQPSATPAPMPTALTELLGCRYPVVQTAMGWVADSKLVAATSNAGGFGFLAAATMSTELLAAEIARVRAATPHRFGVNFHMFQPNAQDVIELVLSGFAPCPTVAVPTPARSSASRTRVCCACRPSAR
jgi:NAD(P)H-dependent flavin oxidoreductase YrpB (nitropropane dioxygenase family)